MTAKALIQQRISRRYPKQGSRDFDHLPSVSTLELSTFCTELGWMGLLGQDQILRSVFVGHPNQRSVQNAARRDCPDHEANDWHPTLRQMLEEYADGIVVDFSDVEIEISESTDFRRKVIFATRRLAYGTTVSYGELARRVGHPGAARAVGTVMSSNRFPILIPCHRVLASAGRLGGYTCPAGIDLKRQLLEMEANSQGQCP